ncbi:anoctamin-9 isoform X2 [Melanotaenia boesemani]|uniref:anoctamin-9 isoform X2 n=1 Tax=Melanotaenia boesemani TaxID=1250792 RepID=UPI001C05C011|nr:anoctamin-9 isoform X2 [Melanotaenia boesemani]
MFRADKDNVELCDRQTDALNTESLLPSAPIQRTYDYILVSSTEDEDMDQKALKRTAFLKELENKKITVTTIIHDDKLFFGLLAPNEMFEDYQYLLKVSDSCNWSGDVTHANRIRIIHSVLHQTCINTGENLEELLLKDVFESMFCLHEKNEQKKLQKNWARWTALFTRQPFSDVKCYFGEKVALYYLWLDWYTRLLVPAAAIGVVVFLYALAFFNTSPLIKEVCQSNITMCPRCDKTCQVWELSDTCSYAKVSHLFDNEGTVAFAMFMAIWATLFLELWKRHRAKHVSDWKVYDWSEEEEELIMDIVNDPNCNTKKFRHSYLRTTLVLTLVTVMLMLIIGLAHALVVFRVVAAPLLSEWEFLRDHANTVAVMLGAVLHYVTIQIMTRVNRWVSLKLCKMEELNSLAAKERSFTVKMFTFQFFTLFSSLFYVAFFLGRINGHPGKYVRIAGFRLEECHPSGCLTDLFIQMAVIMLLKQTVNNIFEFTVPWLKSILSRKAASKLERKCGYCYRKACRVEPCDLCKLQDWLRNYHLANSDAFSLFNEFLEMVIQFSFTTIFVAAFPLAPLLAFLNNIFEIRLDAIKMVRLEKRLIPRKTNDIGVWTQVLEAIGVLAVIANGLVIGFTSDFIPRLVYRYHYGPCATGNTNTHCMEGYINDTLATAFMSTENQDMFINAEERHHLNVTQCSYRDYRNEDYSLTSQFWLVLATRFAFVVLFEHVVVICKFVAAWFVPGNPTKVKNDRLEDKLGRLKDELRVSTSSPRGSPEETLSASSSQHPQRLIPPCTWTVCTPAVWQALQKPQDKDQQAEEQLLPQSCLVAELCPPLTDPIPHYVPSHTPRPDRVLCTEHSTSLSTSLFI